MKIYTKIYPIFEKWNLFFPFRIHEFTEEIRGHWFNILSFYGNRKNGRNRDFVFMFPALS
jgi:hypothetical protein